MKKYLFLAIILVIMAQGSDASPRHMGNDASPRLTSDFAPVGAEWYFNVIFFVDPGVSYHKNECIGDTVILGHDARIISDGFYSYMNEYVYEDNGLVYWYNRVKNDFSLLYDFNAEAGEGWYMGIDSCEYYVHVNFVEEIVVNGITYEVQYVECEDPMLEFYGKIIKGIGYVHGLFPKPYACQGEFADGDYPNFLRCYLVDDELLYKQGPYECDEVVIEQYWNGSVADSFAGGSGTEDDPYLVENGGQLALLAKLTNEGNENYNSAYYRQIDDINLNMYYQFYDCWGMSSPGVYEWISIGTRIEDDANTYNWFSGNYDGNNYSVLGLYQGRDTVNYQDVKGLFGAVKNAEIKNLKLNYSYIEENNFVGGITGYAKDSKIQNCFVWNAIIKSNNIAGGISAMAECSDFSGCRNIATVEADSTAGGILGYGKFVNIKKCINQGVIKGIVDPTQVDNYYGATGGISGVSFASMIVDCDNGNTIESGFITTGGICGLQDASKILNCANTGNVSGTEIVGGISGFCINSMVNKDSDPNSCIVNSYNTASVTGSKDVGGILGIGSFASSISNVYNFGEISGSESTGCIMGSCYVEGYYNNCYWHANENYPAIGSTEYPTVLQNSSSFAQGNMPTFWGLDTMQYGTFYLLTALNLGVTNLNDYFSWTDTIAKSWRKDKLLTNNGLPIFSDELPFAPAGAEWYYEILGGNGITSYQHLKYASDSIVNQKDVKVIIKTDTLFDNRNTIVNHEYIYEENDTVYWYNTTLDRFTMLYDFSAEEGDEWQIFVDNQVITMHVDGIEIMKINGTEYKVLHVSDNENLFSGDIVKNIGHLTSFFPEALMSTRNDFRVNGMRCYWINGGLILKRGEIDCDAIYQTFIGLEEPTIENIKIYPNPAKDIVYIELDKILNCNYFIYNMMGQIVKQGILNENEINISELRNGLYLLDCKDITIRFIIMK